MSFFAQEEYENNDGVPGGVAALANFTLSACVQFVTLAYTILAYVCQCAASAYGEAFNLSIRAHLGLPTDKQLPESTEPETEQQQAERELAERQRKRRRTLLHALTLVVFSMWIMAFAMNSWLILGASFVVFAGGVSIMSEMQNKNKN